MSALYVYRENFLPNGNYVSLTRYESFLSDYEFSVSVFDMEQLEDADLFTGTYEEAEAFYNKYLAEQKAA